MEQKNKLPAVMLAATMIFSLSGCTGNQAVSSSSTYIEEVSSAVVSEPESSAPVVKTPPVDVVYNEEYDTNKDGSIDIDEWNVWVKDHPEDTNKDMVAPEEKQKYEDSQKPAVSSKPSTSSSSKPAIPSKPATSSKPNTANNSNKGSNEDNQALLDELFPLGGEKMTPDEAYTEDQGVKPGF